MFSTFSYTEEYKYALKVNSEGDLFKRGTHKLLKPHIYAYRAWAAIIAGEDLRAYYGMSGHDVRSDFVNHQVLKTVTRFLTNGSKERTYSEVVQNIPY